MTQCFVWLGAFRNSHTNLIREDQTLRPLLTTHGSVPHVTTILCKYIYLKISFHFSVVVTFVIFRCICLINTYIRRYRVSAAVLQFYRATGSSIIFLLTVRDLGNLMIRHKIPCTVCLYYKSV